MVDASGQQRKKRTTYDVIKKLGEGGQGRAYLVQAKGSKKMLVAKSVSTEGMTDDQVANAQKEAKVLMRLEGHPNVIKIKEYYLRQKEQEFHIIMEYASEGDLDKQIQEARSTQEYFTEDEVLNIFTSICMGVKHCHDRKVIHRDIKTENIFINHNGDIKLGDFGIARVLSSTYSAAETKIGTMYAMAPEFFESENASYRFKTDIWALGTVLYELAALKLPFEHTDNVHEMMRRIAEDDPEPLPDHYSENVTGLVDMLLQKDPDNRPTINQILNGDDIKARA
jgi:NIMA (never in mitosis gene a)-related kinase 1/4/5